jgi:hypothetical protein
VCLGICSCLWPLHLPRMTTMLISEYREALAHVSKKASNALMLHRKSVAETTLTWIKQYSHLSRSAFESLLQAKNPNALHDLDTTEVCLVFSVPSTCSPEQFAQVFGNHPSFKTDRSYVLGIQSDELAGTRFAKMASHDTNDGIKQLRTWTEPVEDEAGFVVRASRRKPKLPLPAVDGEMEDKTMGFRVGVKDTIQSYYETIVVPESKRLGKTIYYLMALQPACLFARICGYHTGHFTEFSGRAKSSDASVAEWAKRELFEETRLPKSWIDAWFGPNPDATKLVQVPSRRLTMYNVYVIWIGDKPPVVSISSDPEGDGGAEL